MLNASRRARMELALQRFRDYCHADPGLSSALAGEPFAQGSLLTKTVLNPLPRCEFDADMLYPFKLEVFDRGERNPQSVVDWFIGRLNASPFYAPRLVRAERCVRIEYTGGFHIDLVPATADVANCRPLAIPGPDFSDWTPADPLGFARWTLDIDQSAGGLDAAGDGYFTRCVRYMKRWRDHCSDRRAFRSMTLVTILGKNHPAGPHAHDAAYLYDLLRVTHGSLMQPPEGLFANPTLYEENLAGRWDPQLFAVYAGRLAETISWLEKAILAATERESLQHYRRALGDSFPGR